MSDERKRGVVLPIVVTLAVLLGLYVGSYYAMVDPQSWKPIPLWMPHYRAVPESFGDAIYIVDDWAVTIFAPMNWLDRRIRPQIWDP